MTRIYTPHAYGLFAIFNSLLSNLVLISSLSYGGAFLLEPDQKRFYALVHLTFLLSLATFLLTLLTLLLFKAPIVTFFNIEELGLWIYFLPVILFLSNINSIMKDWLFREKQFKKATTTDVISNLTGRITSLGYGLLIANTSTGLIVADFVGRVYSFFAFLSQGIYRKISQLSQHFSLKTMRSVALKYKDFPLFQLPTYYVDFLAFQVPVYALATVFGASSVGLYSFAITLLELPLSLLARSIAPVFFQKATELVRTDPERLKEVTLSIYNKLFYFGLLPLSL